LSQGFKITHKSCSIPRHKLSLDISIQILIIKDISQYPNNLLSCNKSTQQPLCTKLKY